MLIVALRIHGRNQRSLQKLFIFSLLQLISPSKQKYHATNVVINFLSPLVLTHIENTNNHPPSSENRRFICCVQDTCYIPDAANRSYRRAIYIQVNGVSNISLGAVTQLHSAVMILLVTFGACCAKGKVILKQHNPQIPNSSLNLGI